MAPIVAHGTLDTEGAAVNSGGAVVLVATYGKTSGATFGRAHRDLTVAGIAPAAVLIVKD